MSFRLSTIILFLGLLFSLPGMGQNLDTIPTPTEYTGYRVHLGQYEILKKSKKCFRLKCKMINTGRFDLTKEEFEPNLSRLIISFDEKFGLTELADYKDLIAYELRKQKWEISAGGMIEKEIKVKIPKERRLSDDAFVINVGRGTGLSGYNRKLCVDLMLDSLSILDKSKKSVKVRFRVSNVGKGALNIIGDKKDENDNVQIGAFFSGTKSFRSRSSNPAAIQFMTGLEETKGILFPGDSVFLEMEISRKSQTRYTNILIIMADANQMILECIETNNHEGILVK